MFMFDPKMATVRPYLLLGGAPHEQDFALLRGAGVTHILQVGSELRPSFPDRFGYLRISLDDSEQEDIVRHLPRCFEFIDSARGRKGYSSGDDSARVCDDGNGNGGGGGVKTAPSQAVILVHCMAGMSRSATVVVSYVMWSEKLSYTEAFRQVKAARPCIYPNLGFLLQVWEWEAGGCRLENWPGWNKNRLADRLAEYRRAQAAAGLHPAVRVRLPMVPPDSTVGVQGGSSAPATAPAPASVKAAATGAGSAAVPVHVVAGPAVAVAAEVEAEAPPPPCWSFEAQPPAATAAVAAINVTAAGGSENGTPCGGVCSSAVSSAQLGSTPSPLLPPPPQDLTTIMGVAGSGVSLGGAAGLEAVQC